MSFLQLRFDIYVLWINKNNWYFDVVWFGTSMIGSSSGWRQILPLWLVQPAAGDRSYHYDWFNQRLVTDLTSVYADVVDK